MRSQCVLYVDAGYLLHSAAARVTGTSLRNGVRVDYPRLIELLVTQAEALAGVPLLRVHWYDAAKDAVPDGDQVVIGTLPRVKVRLGRISINGEQKGVDLRIGLDMVTQARNGAADVIVLMSGDDDLTEAVEEAQVHGVQVIILAVPDQDGRQFGVSKNLLRASDGVELCAAETLDQTVIRSGWPGPWPTSSVAVPQPEPHVPRPTPGTVMSARTVPRPSPPGQPAAPAVPAAKLVYASGVDGAKGIVSPEYSEQLDNEINRVVTRVIDSFLGNDAEGQRASLLESKPSIPREVDRALLLDLAHSLNDNDLSDAIRQRLRNRFWASVEEASV